MGRQALRVNRDRPQSEILQAALRTCRRHFVAAAVFSAFLNLLFLAPTLYMLQVYNRVVPARSDLTLGFLTLVLVFALATLSMLDMVRSRLLVRASVKLDRELSGVILDSTLGRRTGGADGLTRQAMREFDTLRQNLTGAGVLALFDAPWTPIYILVCFMLHPALGALCLLGAILLVALTWMNEQATRARLLRANSAANIAYVSQEDSASRSETVRALGMRHAMVQRHLEERAQAAALQTEANFAGSGYMATTRFVRLGLQSLALGLGAWLAVHQQISAGAIFAASFLVSRALAPIEQVLGAWRGLVQARGAWRTLSEVLQRPAVDIAVTRLPAPTGKIAVESMGVANATRDGAILGGISFAADKGECIGVIGPSGAGKSTLIRALVGAIAVDAGAIRYDGAEIRDYDPERLARHIGYMPQEPSLFRGTVKDNIARFRHHMGEEELDERAIEAAKAAGAHEMILHLPHAYDTPLGFGGRGLSLGQAQRIALARALYGDPSIVALDEPNAHLDTEGEAQLMETLRGLKARGATTLVVAHRPSVLPAFDKIMVLRDGRIELFGARDEVIQRLAPKPVPRVTPAKPAASGKGEPPQPEFLRSRL